MRDYAITTDSSCDFDQALADSLGVTVVPLSVQIGPRRFRNAPGEAMDSHSFYQLLSQGELAQTSAPNVEEFKAVWRPILQSGRDLLYLGFSSGLSGTYHNAAIAAEDLREEFPVITVRKQYLRSAVDELLWIWQKKSNNVHDLNSHIWDAWADETGSIGKAYGYQLGVKHHYPQGDMDQVDKVLWDLKHDPASRRILTSLYNHHDLSEMALYPCAYSMTINDSGNTLNGILNQRSQDMLTANGWNVMQYAVLLHMMAQVSGLEAGELIHVIADAHIYDRHVPIVEELIARTPYDAPAFWMDRSVTDFYAFTRDSFRLEGYQAHLLEAKIPVAV